MIITIIIMLLSILLDGIFLCIFKDFISFFYLSCMIILFMINENKKRYYIIIFIFGMIYDLLYNNTLFLDGFLYLFIMYIINFFIKNSNNFIKMFFSYNLSIIIYIIFMYVFAIYFNNDILRTFLLVKRSIIINYLYFIIIYITIYIIYKFK